MVTNVNGRLMKEREPTSTRRNVFGGIRLLKRFQGEISIGEDDFVQLPTEAKEATTK